jgi:hypothetical protein
VETVDNEAYIFFEQLNFSNAKSARVLVQGQLGDSSTLRAGPGRALEVHLGRVGGGLPFWEPEPLATRSSDRRWFELALKTLKHRGVNQVRKLK